MDEVNQAAVSEWALGKLTTALREFREGSAPFHVVVSCFSMCEQVGIERLVLNSFARGALVGVPVSSEVEPDLLAMSVYELAIPVRVQNVLVPVSPVIACRGCRCRWFYGIRAVARGANCSGFLLPSPSQLIKPFPASAFFVGACLLGLCRRQDF